MGLFTPVLEAKIPFASSGYPPIQKDFDVKSRHHCKSESYPKFAARPAE